MSNTSDDRHEAAIRAAMDAAVERGDNWAREIIFLLGRLDAARSDAARSAAPESKPPGTAPAWRVERLADFWQRCGSLQREGWASDVLLGAGRCALSRMIPGQLPVRAVPLGVVSPDEVLNMPCLVQAGGDVIVDSLGRICRRPEREAVMVFLDCGLTVTVHVDSVWVLRRAA